MGNIGKNFLIWLVIILTVLAAANLIYKDASKTSSNEINFTEFLTRVDSGEITSVVIKDERITGKTADGLSFATYAPPNYSGLVDRLSQQGVNIRAIPRDEGNGSLIGIIISSLLPFLIMIGIWFFLMRQMQGGSGKGGAMGFGKSRAKLLTEKTGKVTFKDVAGVDEAKEELVEIVDFLRDATKFQKLGGKIPKGCLLVGPPGTGKTLLARAVAGEAGVPFFTISGSDFVEMFVGVGASRVRDMFEQGKKNAPCLIFIDEIDAVGRHRGVGMGGGNDEREQTLNQMLVEMDGFESNEGVIIIAATNRPDVLDPALLRPGRFDRQVVVPNPDVAGREQILKVHLQKIPLAPDVDAKIIARGTPGFSGAELANLVNEAALIAARYDRKVVTMREMDAAKDKVMMGRERRSMVMSDEEKKLTAYHEAGHAVVALHSPASDPIHKATIVPRGQALGMVMRLPEGDQLSMTREKIWADLAVAMGGRVAEEIIFGYDKVTSGASSDIKHATKLSKAMVTEWGMNDEIGPVYCSRGSNDMYASSSNEISEQTASLIDKHVRKIVEEAHNIAHKILSEHMEQLHNLAEGLLEYETLSGDEIKKIVVGEKIRHLSDEQHDKANHIKKFSKPNIGDVGVGSDYSNDNDVDNDSIKSEDKDISQTDNIIAENKADSSSSENHKK